jgi:hypothetical protein
MTDANNKIPDKTDVILNNLAAGKLIKPKMYNNLLQKVTSGDILSKKDLETFDILDKELRGIYTPEESAGSASSQLTSDQETKTIVQESTPEAFENLHAVVQYLQTSGYKIKKSAIYNHQTAGKIRPNKEGKYPLADVEKYAKTHLKLSDGTPSGGKLLDKAQKDKLDVETREKLARARHWELRVGSLEQKLIPRETVETDLAARASIFRTDGENFFRSQAPAIINIVDGDATKTPDLIDFCLNAFEHFLSRYLQEEEFKVDVTAYEKIFEQAGKDETEEENTDENE